MNSASNNKALEFIVSPKNSYCLPSSPVFPILQVSGGWTGCHTAASPAASVCMQFLTISSNHTKPIFNFHSYYTSFASMSTHLLSVITNSISSTWEMSKLQVSQRMCWATLVLQGIPQRESSVDTEVWWTPDIMSPKFPSIITIQSAN